MSFLKSKLDEKARELLPETIASIEQIENALSNMIKPDNSKVVAGRMAGLQIKENNFCLTNALQQSLVIEGVTKGRLLKWL